MRNAFADELTRIGEADARVVLLSGDIGNKLFDRFKERFPGRFFNCGVAEANLMGGAAGLALSGLRPVAYTITPFITTRCLEQIRVDVCYHEAPVTIVAVGAGLAYASLGPTHHACEERAALRAALQQDGPVYIRMAKKGEPKVHDAVPTEFSLGRGLVLREG